MTKKKLMQIGVIVLSIMILIGIALSIYLHTASKRKNIININIDGNETKNVEFKNLSMVPGEKIEYIINLKSEVVKECKVTLRFQEIEEQNLKNYVYVQIETNDEKISEQLLKNLLEDKEIVIPVDFTKEKKKEIKISYYLPEEVGNEAQNAEASFELLITTTNE